MARITGKFGAVYIGAGPSKVLDVFDWVFENTTEILDCTIKGDFFSRNIASLGSARFTARRYTEIGGTFALLVQDAALNNTQLNFRLDLVDANGTFDQIQGRGHVTRGGLTAPRGPVEDSLEVVFDGEYVIS